MGATTLHLRSETKPFEHRSALTPTTAKALIDAGYTVNIERSPVRIFEDSEFEKAGATLVPEGSWPEAPADHIIIGLKELPENDTFPLKHTHVQFAHCYKNQGGWEQVLSRFPNGKGTLLDLEFLAEKGRRVAAFGYHAGFAGAALAVQAWNHQLQTGTSDQMPGVKPYSNEDALIKKIKEDLAEGEKKSGRTPRALVIGRQEDRERQVVNLLTPTRCTRAMRPWSGRASSEDRSARRQHCQGMVNISREAITD